MIYHRADGHNKRLSRRFQHVRYHGVCSFIRHFVIPPDADLHELPGSVRDEMDIDIFT